MIKRVWKIENGEGHWMIYYNGEFKSSCDDHELTETIREIENANAVSE